jgi:hypothetical protein
MVCAAVDATTPAKIIVMTNALFMFPVRGESAEKIRGLEGDIGNAIGEIESSRRNVREVL